MFNFLFYKLYTVCDWSPKALSPFRGGEGGLRNSMTRIAMLTGVFILTQARQVEG